MRTTAESRAGRILFEAAVMRAAPPGPIHPRDADDRWVSLIADTREHPLLPYVVRQHAAMAGLPVVFMHGPGNRRYVMNHILPSMPSMTTVDLGADIRHINDYNDLMMSAATWNHSCFRGRSKVLIFQWDTMLLRPLSRKEWQRFDYIGAPWPQWQGYPDHGGNGGLSLRSLFAMRACIAHQPPETPEDFFYSKAMHRMGYKVNTRQEGMRFSAETMPGTKPFGVHAPWIHLSPAQIMALTAPQP